MWLNSFCYFMQVLAHGLAGSTILQLPQPDQCSRNAIDHPYLPNFATCTWTTTRTPMPRHCFHYANPSLFWDASLEVPPILHVTPTHRFIEEQLQPYTFSGHGGPSTSMWLKPFCYFVQVLAHGLAGLTILQLPQPDQSSRNVIDHPYLPNFATCTWTTTRTPMPRHCFHYANPSLFWDASLEVPPILHVTPTHRFIEEQLQPYTFSGHGGPSTSMWLKPFCYFVQVLAHGLAGSTILQLPQPDQSSRNVIDHLYLPNFATCTWTTARTPMPRHCFHYANPSLFWDASLEAPPILHVTSTHRLIKEQLQTYTFSGHGGPSTSMWLKPFCYFVQVSNCYSTMRSGCRGLLVLPCPLRCASIFHDVYCVCLLLMCGDIELNPCPTDDSGASNESMLKELLCGQNKLAADVTALREQQNKVENVTADWGARFIE
ncbi:uncharacterized protein [Dermacentor albipictus]|uniref:uncharacterized protein n=1 Tax=Dermacentor albipictus TaxID=60249 RepID=UPI0038FC166B